MIGYVTLGTKDLPRAVAFYDALMKEMGAQRGFENERLVLWWRAPGTPGLGVCTPFDGNTATIGNGDMVALAAENREQVDALYNKAIELGATDEGAPGERFPGFYGGYFRDLDGNKLNFFFMG
ncbi:MAG: VOC family protein [Nevskiales bacterium]|nr:VOC family protein [Nevskiales bacterium]